MKTQFQGEPMEMKPISNQGDNVARLYWVDHKPVWACDIYDANSPDEITTIQAPSFFSLKLMLALRAERKAAA